MQDHGSDLALDLHQFHRFDLVGWLLGRVEARPEWVLCMVEGLPSGSRYKTGSLPNPQEEHPDYVEYEASLAHTNVLLSQLLLAFAGGDNVKPNDVLPSWARHEEKGPAAPVGGSLREAYAGFAGGAPRPS